MLRVGRYATKGKTAKVRRVEADKVNVFLSFASEQRDDAELIAVSLRARPHSILFQGYAASS